MASAVCSHFILTHCNMVLPWGREVGIFLYFKRMKNCHHSIQSHYRLQRLWHEIFRKFILEFNILKACFKSITVISGSLAWASFALKSPVSWLMLFVGFLLFPQKPYRKHVMHCFRRPSKEELGARLTSYHFKHSLRNAPFSCYGSDVLLMLGFSPDTLP